MRISLFLLLVTTFCLFSCKDKGKKSTKDKTNYAEFNQEFNTDLKLLTKDFETWYAYNYYNINLTQDFIAVDIYGNKVDKLLFLNQLLHDNLIPIKTKTLQGKSIYQLFELKSNNEDIKNTIKQNAAIELEHFKMEGYKMPSFNFTDLRGQIYNNASTKGKIVILKCWFINCVACVKEFPVLNKLVDQYKSRNDVIFISLASDSKYDLEKFFRSKQFKYETVPEMKNFMANELRIRQFPTHILINKEGEIKKIVNKIEDIIPFLKIEMDR